MEISNDLFADLLVHSNILCLDSQSPYALEAHEFLFPRTAGKSTVGFMPDPRGVNPILAATTATHPAQQQQQQQQPNDDLNCSNTRSSSEGGYASTPRHLETDVVVSAPLTPDAARRLFVHTFGGNTGTLKIESYLARLMRFGGNTARSCVDVAVILLQRLRSVLYATGDTEERRCNHSAPVTGGTCCSSTFLSAQLLPIPSALLFRAALAAFVIAIKLQSDEFNSMKFYASVGGVTAPQLLRLERTFLILIHYSVSVTAEDYRHFQQSLLKEKGTDRVLTAKCAVFLKSMQHPSSDDVSGSASGVASTRLGATNDDTVLDDSGYSSEAVSVGNTSPTAA